MQAKPGQLNEPWNVQIRSRWSHSLKDEETICLNQLCHRISKQQKHLLADKSVFTGAVTLIRMDYTARKCHLYQQSLTSSSCDHENLGVRVCARACTCVFLDNGDGAD